MFDRPPRRREPEQLLAPPGPGPYYEDIPVQVGGWAELIEKLNWTKAFEWFELRSELTSDFLIYLSRMALVREPMWYQQGMLFYRSVDEMIGDSLSNIEEARMQIAGTLAPIPCENCSRGNGKWVQCVVVTGYRGVTCCANCRWGGQGSRCQWHEAQLQPPRVFFFTGHIHYAEPQGQPEILYDSEAPIEIPVRQRHDRPAPVGNEFR